MSSEVGKVWWNVFEDVRNILKDPETLMAEINIAISALEYARADNFLQSQPLISNMGTKQRESEREKERKRERVPLCEGRSLSTREWDAPAEESDVVAEAVVLTVKSNQKGILRPRKININE
ncbi:RING/U-box superfamily protein [Striga asiatica]|uniref:RING/U-box superfamily protein n=1 Tax=Striga asiatica TaxID=4170 RepID=A0A5A7PBT4_STRAF|nr:RING/U-box superfamily protein [Striga asiatica]